MCTLYATSRWMSSPLRHLERVFNYIQDGCYTPWTGDRSLPYARIDQAAAAANLPPTATNHTLLSNLMEKLRHTSYIKLRFRRLQALPSVIQPSTWQTTSVATLWNTKFRSLTNADQEKKAWRRDAVEAFRPVRFQNVSKKSDSSKHSFYHFVVPLWTGAWQRNHLHLPIAVPTRFRAISHHEITQSLKTEPKITTKNTVARILAK